MHTQRAISRLTVRSILGETGVGKELVARAIHDGSRRREAPLIAPEFAAACSVLPPSRSELGMHVLLRSGPRSADRKQHGPDERCDATQHEPHANSPGLRDLGRRTRRARSSIAREDLRSLAPRINVLPALFA